jgi:hypothetical protein
MANFRPISNLNNISKILERLFLVRFQHHVTSCPNFNSFQSAYRRNHSTETALLLTLDSIFTAGDKSDATLLVALDLSAAFDTIDCQILLTRLKTSFAVDERVLQWLSSYLTNRSQVVAIGNSRSNPANLTAGVPQGSVLGPILFALYISPLGRIISSYGISHQQFADDTQLYISVSPSTVNSSLILLRDCLHSLHNWFSLNYLALNSDKSDCILFSTVQRSKHFPPVPSVDIAGSIVPLSKTVKTLGVTLDSHLTFDLHVQNTTKSCYYHIKALRYIRSSITPETAKAIACSIVCSRLDYANSLLYGVSEANLAKLQRVQYSLAKVVLGPTISSSGSYAIKQLHWLPIKSRIQFKIATLTHKVLSSKEPIYLYSLLSQYSPSRSLRSSNQNLLTQPRTHSVFGSRAFRSCAPSIFNSLPCEIRSIQSVASFRAKLKTHLFCQS